MDFDKRYYNLGLLDALSYKDTVIHRLDPRTKVIATLAFVATVVSFPKYEIVRLVPFFLLPTVILILGDIPVRFLLGKILIASVFALLIGFFNPLLDTRPAYELLGVPISGGWISFFSIILRTLLTVSGVLLLISTTSFPGVSHALKRLGVPGAFISQLLFLYRYLFVLTEETMRMVRARDLRSFGRRGREARVFSALVGTLFVRTVERAERIHQAMLSRGFYGVIQSTRRGGFGMNDVICLSLTAAVLILFRIYDPIAILGMQAERVL